MSKIGGAGRPGGPRPIRQPGQTQQPAEVQKRQTAQAAEVPKDGFQKAQSAQSAKATGNVPPSMMSQPQFQHGVRTMAHALRNPSAANMEQMQTAMRELKAANPASSPPELMEMTKNMALQQVSSSTADTLSQIEAQKEQLQQIEQQEAKLQEALAQAQAKGGGKGTAEVAFNPDLAGPHGGHDATAGGKAAASMEAMTGRETHSVAEIQDRLKQLQAAKAEVRENIQSSEASMSQGMGPQTDEVFRLALEAMQEG